MTLFYFNHDDNKETINRYFDNLGATRIWAVDEAKNCAKNNALLFVHAREEREDWCNLSGTGVYVIFMSTDVNTLQPTGLSDHVHNCMFPADRLTNYPQIEKFIKEFYNNKQWDLLRRSLFPETLTAAYLLMVAQEKISVSLNSLSNEQWKEACEQYKEIGGEKDADWSNASEWGKDDIGKVKKKIGELFSQVASQTR